MEIARLEVRYLGKLLPIIDLNFALASANVAFFFQPHQSAVDVNRRQTDRIGQLFLGERKVVACRFA